MNYGVTAMSTAQFITILIAIIGSSGLWHFLESRFERKDKTKDKKENEKTALENAVLAMLYDRLDPMLKAAIIRENDVVGVEEFARIDNLYKPYSELGGNGTLKRRYDIVNTYDRINDSEIADFEGVE